MNLSIIIDCLMSKNFGYWIDLDMNHHNLDGLPNLLNLRSYVPTSYVVNKHFYYFIHKIIYATIEPIFTATCIIYITT